VIARSVGCVGQGGLRGGGSTSAEYRSRVKVRRWIPVVLLLVLVMTGCSSNELSLTEYVDQVNEAAEQASQRGEALLADAAAVTDLSPQLISDGLRRGLAEVRVPLQEAADEIEPPTQVADLHHLMWDWHAEFMEVEEALADRAGTTPDTAEGWADLSDSPEMEAYRRALADGKQVCLDFQSQLDATAERGTFEDTPWIPSEMRQVVEAVLGCSWFPDDPDAVYRYPPTSEAP